VELFYFILNASETLNAWWVLDMLWWWGTCT